MQTIAAKIVLGSSKCLEELHWLPIQYRINFKAITLIFRCIHGLAPSYLEELIILKKPRGQALRSEDVTKQLETQEIQDRHMQLDHSE